MVMSFDLQLVLVLWIVVYRWFKSLWGFGVQMVWEILRFSGSLRVSVQRWSWILWVFPQGGSESYAQGLPGFVCHYLQMILKLYDECNGKSRTDQRGPCMPTKHREKRKEGKRKKRREKEKEEEEGGKRREGGGGPGERNTSRFAKSSPAPPEGGAPRRGQPPQGSKSKVGAAHPF